MSVNIADAWYAVGLPGAECRHATYCRRPLNELPPVDPPMPEWIWVPDVARPLDWSIGGTTEELDRAFLETASSANLTLPASVRDFVIRRPLRDAIRSGTGCWWSLAPESVSALPGEGTPTVRFLNDQQDVLFWYLLLDGSAEPPVLVSHQDFGEPATLEPVPFASIWRCAPSFHTFMYRFWMENEIFFRSQVGERLTPTQALYLREAQRSYAATATSISPSAFANAERGEPDDF